jgi:hypothetical protein
MRVIYGHRKPQIVPNRKFKLEFAVVIAGSAGYALLPFQKLDRHSGHRMSGLCTVEHLPNQRRPVRIPFRVNAHIHVDRPYPIEQLPR